MKKLIILCLAWMLVASCSRPETDHIVARVGGAEVTVEEFKTRFAMTPYFAEFPSDNPQTRILALASLIGEKLLVEEAGRAGLRDTEKYRAVCTQREKEAIIEALLDATFADIEISPAELDDAFASSRRVLDVEERVFATRAKAEEIYVGLKPVDSLAAAGGSTGPDTADVSTYTLTWGSSEPVIEDVLWRLRPGEVSGPVSYQNSYYIFRIAGERTNPFLSEGDAIQKRPQLRKIIEKRKKRMAYRKLFGSVMAGTSTKVPPEILKYISEEVESALGIPVSDSSNFKPVLMSEKDYVNARASLSGRLQEKFITFADGATWTIADYLSNLRYGPYPLNYSSRGAFRSSLRMMTITMLEHEYLAREGRKRGLQNTRYVIDEKRMWSDAFLSDQMRLRLLAGSTNGLSDTAQLEADPGTAKTARIDEFLSEVIAAHEIEINHTVLDTLRLEHLRMVSFKTHFPGRAVAPLILPFDKLPRFFGRAHAQIVAGERG